MIKKTLKTVLITTLILLVVLLSIKTEKCYQEARKQPKTVYLTDTITNVLYDTVFLVEYKTVKLPIHDTINQTIIRDSLRIDSVFVEVPISKYQLDTTFTTDTTSLNIRIQNSGYVVTLDSLFFEFKYTPRPPKTNFFRDHFKFGAGVSTGFGVFSKKPDIFVGVGLYYTFL